MRKAERQIEQMSLAFDMIEQPEKQKQRFLTMGSKLSGHIKLWHPLIEEHDVNQRGF